VIRLKKPQGPIESRDPMFEWLHDAQITARGLQSNTDAPGLISLGCCEACQCSPEGCDVCNPEGLVEMPDGGTLVDGDAPEPKPGKLIEDE